PFMSFSCTYFGPSVSFPDFRNLMLGQFSMLLQPLFDFLKIQKSVLDRPVTTPLPQVVRMLNKTITNSLGAVTLLAVNGYGNDALKIARSVFEGLVTIKYLRKNPDMIDDFVDFDWIRQKRLLDHFKETDPTLLDRMGAAKIREIEENFERVAVCFTNSKGKIRWRWCKASLKQMAKDVGMSQSYPSFYASVSSIQHLDAGGLSLQLGERIGYVLDIEIAPSEKWVKSALEAGYIYASAAAMDYNEIASLGFDKMLEKNIKKFMTGLDALDGSQTEGDNIIKN
ncbi:DUF5677 domain-containing protein, partial [Acidobacteria bacterium AH-259-G07]|nr:DUF5677 domain-containing protein [Acidobacteria bacterium AH-259-G07]